MSDAAAKKRIIQMIIDLYFDDIEDGIIKVGVRITIEIMPYLSHRLLIFIPSLLHRTPQIHL